MRLGGLDWRLLHAEHLRIGLALGRTCLRVRRRRLSRPAAGIEGSVFISIVEVHELLMADEEVSDVHVSMTQANATGFGGGGERDCRIVGVVE